jgi:hypothetical protein
MEKLTPQKKNVPENATIPGEMAAAVEKHPGFWGKTWRNCSREEKCPGKRHNSRRNGRGGGETSWLCG